MNRLLRKGKKPKRKKNPSRRRRTDEKVRCTRFFSSKRVLMILSLLLGIIAWLTVSLVVDPNVTTQIDGIPVQVELTGSAPAQRAGCGGPAGPGGQAQITGAIYTVGNLTADDFTATVDASDNL